MALDKAYFDAIHIDVVKKKYYNANKVNALLADVRAQAAARDIIGKAKVQAGRILADAQRQREEILSGAVDQQEYAAACVERTFDKLKRQQLENIETLNGLWQEFLCGLGAEAPAPAETPETQPDDKPRISELETMVNNIAKELSEIMDAAK